MVSESTSIAQLQLSGLRMRQIHLDFHTSEHIPSVGACFDPDRFAKTMVDAHVDSVTCFGRCHHGLLYYKSSVHRHLVHPNLTRSNLLQEQIDALREHGIETPIYTTVQWDAHVMTNEPGWLCISPEGGWVGQHPLEPGFYATICLNSPYRDFLYEHVDELLTRFSPPGLFLDIVRPVECVCPRCVRLMKQRGLNPHAATDRMQFGVETIDTFRTEMSAFIRKHKSDCRIFYNASHIGPTLRGSLDAFSHLEIESLPSGGWGYTHFPYVARYAQNLDKPVLGMTGRFHTYWGDFHSYKNQAAMEFECFQMLAHGAGCSIGDQLHPGGTLDAEAYRRIGKVYSTIETLEPYIESSKSIARIAVLSTESSAASAQPDDMLGCVRLLQECGYQFDVVDEAMALDKYELLILPDSVRLESWYRDRVGRFISEGGAVLGAFDAIAPCLGVEPMSREAGRREDLGPYEGISFDRNDYTDYLMPRSYLGTGLAESPYVMYLRGRQIQPTDSVSGGASVLERSVPPFFERTPERFCSHQQAPATDTADGAPAVVTTASTLYFAHPVFTIYRERSPLWIKQLVHNAIVRLIGEPCCRHDGPAGLITTLRYNRARRSYILQLLYYTPERKGRTLDIIEDIVPLHSLTIGLTVPDRSVVCEARAIRMDAELEFQSADGGRTSILLPKLNGYELIEVVCE